MNRMRVTKSKRNNRRSHHGVMSPAYTEEDATVRLRHRASRLTGLYRGRQVMDVKQKSGKKQKESVQGDGEKKIVEQATVPK